MKAKQIIIFIILLLLSFTGFAQEMKIKWIIPDEVENLTVNSNEAEFKIDFSILNTLKIQANQIALYRNNTPYLLKGEKTLGNASIKKTDESAFRLNTTVELLEGRNEWKVEVKQDNRVISSKVMTINYINSKPNLYIICVGIENDLQFPKKDAEEIINTFRTQTGNLFEKVEGELLICKDNTTRSFIGNTIANLKDIGLRKQDILILYISGHGQITTMNGDIDFGIVGSDFSQGVNNDEYLLLSYQKDIIRHLEALPCKRLIFFDACRSGATKGDKGKDFAEIQKRISNTPASIITLSSSSSDESSWEDKAWGHGAYTKVMIDGLNGGADTNQDGYVSINELSSFIITGVPKLVLQTKNRVQRPRLAKFIEFDFPIFNYLYRNTTLNRLEENCDKKSETKIQKKIAIISLNPNNSKGYDFQLSRMVKLEIEKKYPPDFLFTPNPQLTKITEKGTIERLINGNSMARKELPVDLQADFFLVFKREPTSYKQVDYNNNQYWLAETVITYYYISTLTGEIIDSDVLSNINGADANKNQAEKRALERFLETLKIEMLSKSD